MLYSFDSRWELGARLPEFPTDAVKNEPMLFSCGIQTAARLGGELTANFLNALPRDWIVTKSLIIDSRVHMLMPGWYPAIPGWHHDDVPRYPGPNGQPNYVDPEYAAEHAMGLYNGEVCPTQFALGKIDLPEVDSSAGPVYGQWHPMVEQAINDGLLKRVDAPTNRVIFFNSHAFHQGVAARKGGWRFFIRATRNTKREIKNEVRRQVQVYLEKPMEGW